MIECYNCDKMLPEDHFELDLTRKDQFAKYCKKCIKEDLITKKIKDKRRWYDFKRKYGVTKRIYNIWLKRQKGLCKICGIIPKKMCIDHNHETGEIRGLLCVTCNIIIGLAKEDTKVLKKMIKYLKSKRKMTLVTPKLTLVTHAKHKKIL